MNYWKFMSRMNEWMSVVCWIPFNERKGFSLPCASKINWYTVCFWTERNRTKPNIPMAYAQHSVQTVQYLLFLYLYSSDDIRSFNSVPILVLYDCKYIMMNAHTRIAGIFYLYFALNRAKRKNLPYSIQCIDINLATEIASRWHFCTDGACIYWWCPCPCYT